MSKAIRLSEDMVGKKVRLVNKVFSFHPEIGSVGTITSYDEDKETRMHYCIKWETKSYSIWMRDKDIEEVVDNGADMTNKEIWEMLKSKMEKNKVLTPSWGTWGLSYYEEYVHNAIALAYKVGYLRSQKGRPFKIGEKKEKKKQGRRWVPVDPENLPKEGTKVRYSRECEDYADNDECICINDTGVVKLEGSWLGVTLDNPRRYEWLCFDDAEDSLDMWVEDDE